MPDPSYEYCRKEDDVFYHTVMMDTKTKTNTKTNIDKFPRRMDHYILGRLLKPGQ